MAAEKVNFSFHRDWLGLLFCYIQLVNFASGLPVCTEIDGTLFCTVKENEDFDTLSSVADDIHLKFESGHSVVFEASLFPALPALKKLTIDLRYITDLSSNAFINLNSLEYLQCENSDIYRPLPDLTIQENTLAGLSSLTELYIKEIGLTSIENQAFNDLTSLLTLTIENNVLGELPDSIFSATSLESITLTNDELREISSNTWQGLNKLKSLTLKSNKLTSLGDALFNEASSSLKELDISDNDLQQISINTFQDLRQLGELSLSKNKLTRLQRNVFNNLESLETLSLEENNIETLDDQVFEMLGKLVFLKLHNNKLQTITSQSFDGLHKLQFLDLFQNDITSISENSFKDSKDLLILHLHENSISSIHNKALTGLSSLNVLTLHDNSLNSMESGTLDSLTSIQFLDISNNPWRCDCDITWIHAWLQDQSSQFQMDNSDNTICGAPLNVQGVPVTTFASNNYVPCLPPTTTAEPLTTAERLTTTEPNAITFSQPAAVTTTDPVLSTAAKTGIIVGCIVVALLIILLVVLMLYCRHKRYAFWAPARAEKQDKQKQSADIKRDNLKFKARHQIGSFYQDPESGTISTMWENNRHHNSDNPERQNAANAIKQNYVYENPALDVGDTYDNSVVVVDNNGATVQSMPNGAYSNGYTNDYHAKSSDERSPPGQYQNVLPLNAEDLIKTGGVYNDSDPGFQNPSMQSDTGAENDSYDINNHIESTEAHSISNASDNGAQYSEIYPPYGNSQERDTHSINDIELNTVDKSQEIPNSVQSYNDHALTSEDHIQYGQQPYQIDDSQSTHGHLDKPVNQELNSGLQANQDNYSGLNRSSDTEEHSYQPLDKGSGDKINLTASTDAHGGSGMYINAAYDNDEDLNEHPLPAHTNTYPSY